MVGYGASYLLLPVLLASPCLSENPCEAEIKAACPDSPGAELAKCLKNTKEHEKETELSSECTDFVALNSACAEDISKHCDDAFFSEDTTLCLSEWTDRSSLSQKCASVMEWAIPKPEGEDGEAATDELGMTEEEAREKDEWRAKRKAVRTDAIERMKMKDVDRKKEEDRVALEKFKEEHPEEYAEMLKQQEEEKRQQAEFKRRERMQQAALERNKRKAAGLSEEEDKPSKAKARTSSSKKKSSGSWKWTLLKYGIFGAIICLGYFAYLQVSAGGKGAKGGKKKQGKRN